MVRDIIKENGEFVMTIQQCRYILKIAECGSFNEAARQLFVAQSSLSVSVKSLEQELNIKIFERSGNGVYLTDECLLQFHYIPPMAMPSCSGGTNSPFS